MSPPTNNWGERRTKHLFMRKTLRTSQHGTQKTHKMTTQKTKI
jgi:hypothetical protein